jgi:aminodeoxyfutalosine synthase
MTESIQPGLYPEPLRDLAEKVRDGVRLDADDTRLCFSTPHLLQLGQLADHVRRRLHGDIAYYNVNRHINPTNVCVYTYNCKFCSFAALPGEDHAWQMSHDEVYEHAAQQGGNEVTEFHIVGGLHPDLSFDWYLEMIRGLKERFPAVHLKAFTAIEIGWFAQLESISIEEVLTRLRDAGLGSLPGGGAEIFHAEVREVICDGKLDADEWIEVHRIAHGLGIRSNCTMLYGHVETAEHKVDHLLRLRALQDETGGFNAFIPLAYHPENNYLGLKYHSSGSDDLRHMATSRLVLDNIPHLKAYWIMLTPKLAQVALSFGADDIDGTVVEETIYHMAGSSTEQQLSRVELERIVGEAGFVPVQRDTLYNPIEKSEPTAIPS